MTIRRMVALAGCVLSTCAGGASLVLGLLARDACDPTSVTWGDTSYTITRRDSGDAIAFDFSHDGRVEKSLWGSTDTLCDDPYLRRFDVDGDGTDDVLVHDCGHYSYLTMRDRELHEEYLGDHLQLRTAWAGEVERGGVTACACGIVLLLVGLGVGVRSAHGPRYRG
ncbi:MAG: uncharacterized protein JWO36_2818 [Myxococcales bacterium]|nr:uncharacterized protein [Myxococcales bacterium]